MLSARILRPALRPVIIPRRAYALSRFNGRQTGTSRSRPGPFKRTTGLPDAKQSQHMKFEKEASGDIFKSWHTSQRPPTSDPEEGLQALLMPHRALIIERQVEMLNIFVGFEQCNKYAISSEAGETIGYIVEESRNLLSVMSRQAFATHRPFRAIIMDAAGSPILWLRRPFAWINSRMYVQRLQNFHDYTREGEPVLDTFGEVQQIWHPWRRRYDVFLREGVRRVLSLGHESQPEPEPEVAYTQFTRVDSGFLAWNFPLYDSSGREIAFIHRAFRGFGREIFTDTGRYTVSFMPAEGFSDEGRVPSHPSIRNLSIDERAVTLALAVNIDFDYFSHHSRVGSGGFFYVGGWEELRS